VKDKKPVLCKDCKYCYDHDYFAGTGLCRKQLGPFGNKNVTELDAPACDLFERKKDETTLCTVHDKAPVDGSCS